MKGLRMAIAFGVVAAAMAIGFSARADTFDKLTILAFSQPVELKDRTQLFTTILAIPNYRVEATGQTVIRFSENAAGAPNAIKEWFYPGDTFGHEFVYPKNRAVELTEASHEPVPAMPTELAPDVTTPVTSRTAPSVQRLERAPLKAEEPSGGETEIAEAFVTSPPSSELPKTASFLPLIGLSGLVLVMTGTMLWGFQSAQSDCMFS